MISFFKIKTFSLVKRFFKIYRLPHATISNPIVSPGSMSGLIVGLRPANERRCYFVTPSLIGWVQAYNQPRMFWCLCFVECLWNSWDLSDKYVVCRLPLKCRIRLDFFTVSLHWRQPCACRLEACACRWGLWKVSVIGLWKLVYILSGHVTHNALLTHNSDRDAQRRQLTRNATKGQKGVETIHFA